MDNDQTAAVDYVIDEIFAHRFGPIVAVVVRDEHIVIAELGPPLLPSRSLLCFPRRLIRVVLRFLLRRHLAPGSFGSSRVGRRRGGCVHGKSAAILQCPLQHRPAGFPIVVVLPVDDEDFQFLGGLGGGAESGECEQTEEEKGLRYFQT